MRQAFDRVWHLGLLFKLKQQMLAPYYMFLKAYIEERGFYVRSSYFESPQHVVSTPGQRTRSCAVQHIYFRYVSI